MKVKLSERNIKYNYLRNKIEIIIMFDLNSCKADKHANLFLNYTITDKTFKATIRNLNSFPNVTINKYICFF